MRSSLTDTVFSGFFPTDLTHGSCQSLELHLAGQRSAQQSSGQWSQTGDSAPATAAGRLLVPSGAEGPPIQPSSVWLQYTLWAVDTADLHFSSPRPHANSQALWIEDHRCDFKYWRHGDRRGVRTGAFNPSSPDYLFPIPRRITARACGASTLVWEGTCEKPLAIIMSVSG